MGDVMIEKRLSLWLIIAAVILDAIMIHPSFWGTVVQGIALCMLLASRRLAIYEGRRGTAVQATRSPAVTPAVE